MAKKREFASDSDVSRFISRKQNQAETTENNTRQQFTIYPRKEDIAQVKILAKINDVNLNTMFLKLINEALEQEKYQKLIQTYKQVLTL